MWNCVLPDLGRDTPKDVYALPLNCFRQRSLGLRIVSPLSTPFFAIYLFTYPVHTFFFPTSHIECNAETTLVTDLIAE